jgi:hypothetical protein
MNKLSFFLRLSRLLLVISVTNKITSKPDLRILIPIYPLYFVVNIDLLLDRPGNGWLLLLPGFCQGITHQAPQ